MSHNHEADCCAYYEEKRRLTRKKNRKQMKDARMSQRNGIDECGEDADNGKEERRESEEKRTQRIENLVKLISDGDKMMSRIQPSIEERDKYSIDLRHIRCFLEPTEIAKLEYEQKMRTILRRLPCESGGDPTTCRETTARPPAKKKKKKKGKENKKKEQREKEKQEPNEETEQEAVRGESDPEADAEKVNSKPQDEKDKKRKKSEFWCRKVEKKKSTKFRDRRLDDTDCKDSVCSFDSHIDLTGLALIKNDIKKINELRRNRMASKNTSEKSA